MPRWLSITGEDLGGGLESEIPGSHQENPSAEQL